MGNKYEWYVFYSIKDSNIFYTIQSKSLCYRIKNITIHSHFLPYKKEMAKPSFPDNRLADHKRLFFLHFFFLRYIFFSFSAKESTPDPMRQERWLEPSSSMPWVNIQPDKYSTQRFRYYSRTKNFYVAFLDNMAKLRLWIVPI